MVLFPTLKKSLREAAANALKRLERERERERGEREREREREREVLSKEVS
jgi:hypothetical protein